MSNLVEKSLIDNKRDSKKSKKDYRDKYFIKDIENITGIKAYTLRIWEQRYGMLVPKRTETNIRYYEEDDLKYMMNIAILNANRFGKVGIHLWQHWRFDAVYCDRKIHSLQIGRAHV